MLDQQHVPILDLPANPFETTKAAYFTDLEIHSMWVDWPAPGGFAEFISLRSRTPRIILGGKGTGRTHVMRHFSAPVQVIRAEADPAEQVIMDGALGIYLQCSGLNASRFQGRGLDDDAWQTIFAQYMDLWLAQCALDSFLAVYGESTQPSEEEVSVIEEICALIGDGEVDGLSSLSHLRDHLFALQRDIDRAVNNAALNPSPTLDINIVSTAGDLVFGVPTSLRRHYEPLQDVIFLYLIDEFENFTAVQQRYINTLIREVREGTSFMIGVRTYGFKTRETIGGGEENRRGSEFEEIRPDRNYVGTGRRNFEDFCKKVVARRLSGQEPQADSEVASLVGRLSDFFEVPSDSYEEQLVIERYSQRERPYLTRLKRHLNNQRSDVNGRSLSDDNVDLIVEAARVPSRPLLEKVNTFLIYRAWANGVDLISVANKMIASRPTEDSSGIILPNTEQQNVLDHYITDMKAQLCNDMRRHPVYAGIDEFITMSEGLPRNLIVILKNVYKWAHFNGEMPFQGGRISLASQRRGLVDAYNWFLADAKPLGQEGENVIAAVDRLCNMFRQFRYSNKPVECSLASFSVELERCSAETQNLLKIAEERSLLVRAESGQKNRNTGLIEPKFHLNRLLCSGWDLPTARRGVIGMSPEEIDAIFAPSENNPFENARNRRLERMNAPFGRRNAERVFQQALDLDNFQNG